MMNKCKKCKVEFESTPVYYRVCESCCEEIDAVYENVRTKLVKKKYGQMHIHKFKRTLGGLHYTHCGIVLDKTTGYNALGWAVVDCRKCLRHDVL